MDELYYQESTATFGRAHSAPGLKRCLCSTLPIDDRDKVFHMNLSYGFFFWYRPSYDLAISITISYTPKSVFWNTRYQRSTASVFNGTILIDLPTDDFKMSKGMVTIAKLIRTFV